MWKHTYIYSIFFLSLCSCQATKDQNKVPESSLKHEVLLKGEPVIGKVRSMALLADSIPVLINAQADVLFQCLDFRRQAVIEFGNRGQGPDDFLFPTSLKGNTPHEVSFWDVNRKRYSSMSIALKDSVMEPTHIFSYKDSLFHYEIFPIYNHQFVAAGIYENYRLVLLDEQGRFKQGYGKCPSRDSQEESLSGTLRSEVYQGRLAVSPSGKKVVHALLRADILSFYEVTSQGDLQLVADNIRSYPSYSYVTGAMDLSAPIYHIDVSATDQYVYVLYSGRNYKADKDHAFLGNRIDVYDWAGKLVGRLHLDVGTRTICVTQNDQTIYAISHLPDPELVSFTLERR